MNQTKRFSRGFTLIELLVVIAIIGILTSVVLASLNSARSKGGDTGVKDNLSTIRTQAEVYYDGAGNKAYGPTYVADSNCATASSMFVNDLNIKAAISQASSNGGGDTKCASTATTWAVAAKLKSVTTYWCVDSTGLATTTAAGAVTGTAGTGICQ